MALDRILEVKRREVLERRARYESTGGLPTVEKSERSLTSALARPGLRWLLEVKTASPSLGSIRPTLDLDEVARVYGTFADGISVLTDASFFGGSHDRLRAVRSRVRQPVLCKDFVLDPWQVHEARAFGADAVLLMLSVLDDTTWRACASEAAAHGVDVLTEVHDDEELERALSLGAPLLGINNRNLKTLEIDLATTERLAARVPRDRVLISESGIRTRSDVARLAPWVDGFLVGSQLMGAADLLSATADLTAVPWKVCGLTRVEDARAARALGARWGGLILAPESPRALRLEAAQALRQAVDLDWVLVFVNAPLDEVAVCVDRLRPAAVQLHGEETRDYVDALRARVPEGVEIWKAVRVRDEVPALAATGADRMVCDTWVDGQRGGTGRTFSWALLSSCTTLDRVILSGGLRQENAAEAARLGVAALDVNSGVERAPGVKDIARMQAWVEALRPAGRGDTRGAVTPEGSRGNT